MNFCSQCGGAVVQRIPAGDDRLRHVCDACDTVHYSNPKIVAGCIIEVDDKLLLCRRAINPRYGYWTIPAGFMENGETVQQAAARETWEEAQAEVEIIDLYAVYNLPFVNQVYMIFRGHLPENRYAPGPESLQVGLFDKQAVPWENLAFKVVKAALNRFYDDKPHGLFPGYVAEITRK